MTRTQTKYFYTLDDEREIELPFDPGTDDIEESHHNGKIILSCLVHDEDASDPIAKYDEGEFYQFDHRQMHDADCPDPEDFKDIILENKGRVFYIEAYQEGYGISHKALIKNAGDIEDADGYYITPAGVTWPEKYARGVVEEYSNWCKGEVYGVCLWYYDEASLEELERQECWSYIGAEYASETLADQLKSAMEIND